jgi:hypothetical protein
MRSFKTIFSARLPLTIAMLAALLCALALGATPAKAAFGIAKLAVSARNQDGTPDVQAGSHPYALNTTFVLEEPGRETGNLKDVTLELPPGLVGNPEATPRCTYQEFIRQVAGAAEVGRCPDETAVGIATFYVQRAETRGNASASSSAVYNLVPPPGVVAEFGYVGLESVPVLLEESVRTGGDYGVTTDVPNVNAKVNIYASKVTIWGTPADSSHDQWRGSCLRTLAGATASLSEGFGLGEGEDELEGPLHLRSEGYEPEGLPESTGSCPTGAPQKPLLTLPTSCAGPLTASLRIDSWQQPLLGDEAKATLPAITGCSRPGFSPAIAVTPEHETASTASGLHVDLHVPQEGTLSPTGLGNADLKNATVTLPPGLVVNPSSAEGLVACSPAQIELHGPEPATCPGPSKLGTVEVESPLISHPLPGSVYLAEQRNNPFGSLLAIYVAVNDPVTGVVVKLAGNVHLDPSTGQISATFSENPQLPFEDFRLDFKAGDLTTPATCGSFTTTTDMTPWTSPEGADAFPTSTFKVSSGAGGGACASTEAALPNKPSFEAGTTTPIAGAYSPFVLRLTREEGTQPMSSIDTTLPAGLLGKIAGVGQCSDAQIAQAVSRSHEGDGALEQASPSCPSSSEIGIVNVGAGSGTPYYVQGHAYLAGPYKGAPLSLEIVTPAVAGPFDLGVVAVRTALYVNESTAQISAISDPIPHILDGIPLDVRSIAVRLNRPSFTLNPTSCAEKEVTGTETSIFGNAASLRNRFQVGACSALAFKPGLKLFLSGQTKRTGNPALKAVLTQPAGDNSNIATTSVILPKGMLIDNAHINSPCTRVIFNEGAVPGERCSPKSILGTAKVWTPLLEKPEEGNVYFRSNGGERQLPDLVVALRGQIPVQLVGFIDSVGKKGAEVRRVRTRFQTVPDAPLSRFELKLYGGKKGLLENSQNLCKAGDKATYDLTGQNGKAYDTEPLVQVSCGKGKPKKAGKKGGGKKK